MIDVIGILLGAILLLVIGALGYYLWIINFARGANIIRDISRPLSLANSDEPELRQLARLGFNGLGILEYRYFWRKRSPRPLWYYIDPAATTCVEISTHPFVQGSFLIRLFSWFPDRALLETFYDYGETINEADFNVRFASHDLAQAYASHQSRLSAFAEAHGQPNVFHDVKHLIPLDTVDRERHRRRRLRRTTRTALMLIGCSALALGVIALSMITERFSPGLVSLIMMTAGLSICLALMARVLYAFRFPSGALDSVNRP